MGLTRPTKVSSDRLSIRKLLQDVTTDTTKAYNPTRVNIKLLVARQPIYAAAFKADQLIS